MYRSASTLRYKVSGNGHLIITEFKVVFLLGSPLHRENRETVIKKKYSPVSENTGDSEMLPKFREAENLACSSDSDSLILEIKFIAIFAARISFLLCISNS